MKKELIDKLMEIQSVLHNGGELGRKRLEELGEEAMTAFDTAIKKIDLKINIREEIDKRRDFLKKWKLGFFKSVFPPNVKYMLAAPFIYGMIVPALILHITAEIYQQVAFRFYGIPRVRAREFFFIDRALLPYLNILEKINCVYCSYVNNLLQFAVEIAGRTERFWCPIKYANRMKRTHSQYELFVDFMDAENFRDKWEKLRDFSDIQGPAKTVIQEEKK